jgi:cell division protein FtsW
MKLMPFKILLLCMFVLVMFGLVMVYSSSAIVSGSVNHDSFYFVKRQLVFIFLSGGAFVFALYIQPNLYQRYGYPIYIVMLLLLASLLIPGIGKSAGGAARWISLGVFRLQPGELFKFALIIYLAKSLAEKANHVTLFSVGIIPHILIPGIAMFLLMLEPDFGTTFMVATLTFVMLFIGGAPVTYLLLGILLAIPIALQMITSSHYRLERVIAFLDPWSHRQNEGYQVVESLMAFGSGGFWGLGLGRGPGKLHFLPAAHTDFILAIIGEELGFIGISFIIICFLLIAIYGFKIALSLNNPFQIYLAAGLTTLITLQAIFNAFVVMGLVPTKGITLPFVSYGGSSLIMSCFMVGVLVRLAQESTTLTDSKETIS